MADEPASAIRARDLDGAFETVHLDGSHHDGTATTPGAFRGREIKVYALHTPLSAETSYVHDYPEHPLETRCAHTGRTFAGNLAALSPSPWPKLPGVPLAVVRFHFSLVCFYLR